MKSAYELAMERLAGTGPVISLTDEQRAEIGAIDDRFRAKIAERELFLNDLIAKAVGSGNYHEVPDLKTQLAREIASLRADGETAKDKVRG
jgi:hypothetical protein